MSKADTLRKQVVEAERNLEALKKELQVAKGEEFFTCSHCERRSKVKSTSLLSEYYYEEPYGCTGGDMWHFSQYIIVCGKCYGTSNGRRSDELDEFIRNHLGSFLEVLKWYPRNSDPEHLTLEYLRSKQ